MKRLGMLTLAVVTAALTLMLYPAPKSEPTEATTPTHYLIAVAEAAIPPKCAICEYLFWLSYWQICQINPYFCIK